MNDAVNRSKRPPGHVGAAVAAIGALSLALAAGLQFIGVLGRFDRWVASLVSRGGAQTFPQQVPAAVTWLAAAALAFGLAFAILRSPGRTPRFILWITTMVLVATWAPVLSLAAYFPGIGAAWIATAWAGVCAIVYATNHRMPGETTDTRR